MKTDQFPVTIMNPEFGAKAEARITPDSESIVIIKFTKPDGTDGITAVLVSPCIYGSFKFDADNAVYPILIPGCEINVTFRFHANTLAASNTILAEISVKSNFDKTSSRIHGL
jgi:hypothetical protein